MSFVFFFYSEHPKAFLVTGRVQRPSSIGAVVACASSVTKGVFRGKFGSLCAALILQHFVYDNRERVGVGLSQVCMVIWYAVHTRLLVCECFACDGGPSWNLLLSAVESGKECIV